MLYCNNKLFIFINCTTAKSVTHQRVNELVVATVLGLSLGVAFRRADAACWLSHPITVLLEQLSWPSDVQADIVPVFKILWHHNTYGIKLKIVVNETKSFSLWANSAVKGAMLKRKLSCQIIILVKLVTNTQNGYFFYLFNLIFMVLENRNSINLPDYPQQGLIMLKD